MNKDDKEIEKGLNLIAKSSIFVFFGILLSKLFMYLYRIIIARYYGPEIYGLFSLAIMVFGFFIAFTSLGFFDGILRYIPIYRVKKQKHKIQYLISFSSKVLLTLSIISGALLFFTSEFIALKFFNDANLILYLKILSFLIPIQILTNIYFSVIRSHERIKANAFGVNILQNLAKFIFILLFIFFGIASSKAVSFSYLLAILCGLIFAYLYCKIKLPYIFLKSYLSKDEKLKVQKKLFSYSWPLIIYAIIGTLMYYLDTFLIGYFQNSYWVGIYNSAIPIAMLLILFSEIFMQMFFPLITREISSKNRVVVKELSKQITKWIFILNLPITILMLLFSGVFINLFFGSEYLPAVNALRILVLGQFFYSIGIVSNNLLLSYGKSKIILSNLIFTSIINFILNWNLIPKYGINGAAFATFISLTLLAILVISENYYFNKILPFRRKIIPIFLISLIPTMILYLISQYINVNIPYLILLGILFMIIYFSLIFLTKSFDKNDIIVLKKILRRD